MELDLRLYLKLKSLIDELIERSENGAVIIVEGKNDRKALRDLGIYGDIVEASKISNSFIVDRIRRRDVIILTDWDKRGEMIKRDLMNKFSSWGIIPDTEIRKKIFSIVKKDVTEVEKLAKFFKKQRDILFKNV